MPKLTILCKTLLVFTSTLLPGILFLYLIFSNRILSIDDSKGIYTNVAVGIVLTLSSFASTVAPLLLAFNMDLLAYPVAYSWSKWSAKLSSCHIQRLPSPNQYGLALKLFSAPGCGSGLSLSRFFFVSNRPAMSPLLIAPGAQLLWLLILGWAIAATDLYLHATTKAVNLDFTMMHYEDRSENSLRQIRPLFPTSDTLAKPLTNFSATLNMTFCPDGTPQRGNFDVVFSNDSTCTIVDINTDTKSLINATDYKQNQSSGQVFDLKTVIEVYNNQSAIFRVNQVNDTLFLGPAADMGKVDFKASTIGIKTTCRSITDQCQYNPIESEFNVDGILSPGQHLLGYNCSVPSANNTTQSCSGVYGSTLKLAAVYLLDNLPGALPNSFTYVTSIALDVQSPSIQDARIEVVAEDVQYQNGFWISIQLCNSEVEDINYTYYSNTTSFEINNMQPSEAILVKAAKRPFKADFGIVQSGVQRAAQVAIASQNTFPESFATELSRLAVSFFSGPFIPVPSISEAWWETQIVTCIPKAPFIVLEAFLFTYAFYGLTIGVVALIAHRKAERIISSQRHEGTMQDTDSGEIALVENSARMLPSLGEIHDRLTDPQLVVDDLFGRPTAEKSQLVVTAKHDTKQIIWTV